MISFLVTFLSLPLLILNYFSGIVGTIWIIMLGDWNSLIFAFIITIVAPFVLAWPLMLSIIFIYPGMWLIKFNFIGKLLSYPFFILGGFTTWFVMYYWGIIVFEHGILRSYNYNASILLPYLLLCYSISTSPWSYMASKEGPENMGVVIPLFFTQIGSAWMFFGIYSNDFEINFIYLVYLLIMTIGFLISVLTGAIGLTTIKNQN